MTYNNELYALLEDGTIEPLYYHKSKRKLDLKEPRDFYKEGNNWYLDHDKFSKKYMARFHHKIIAFGNTKKELKEKQNGNKKTNNR